MMVMMGGHGRGVRLVVCELPRRSRFADALHIAGRHGQDERGRLLLRPDDRYNFWSGITGGFFLALSYFGTDQSQVQRYLSGRSVTESRLGLLFNGLFKIPMQFLILLIGVMVFVFYQFVSVRRCSSTTRNGNKVDATAYAPEKQRLEQEHARAFKRKMRAVANFDAARNRGTSPG